MPESYDPISAPLPDYPEDRSFFLTPPNYDDTEFENFIFVPPDGTTQDNMNPADEDTIYIHPDGSGTYIIVE
ncbi:MAG: hypothetical protein LIO58_02240 [Oscillospiraceae bacterium]|nr:hypothetical protein [Oscillospiraceae bacterium]